MDFKKLEYFVGKPCTVSTVQINFRFKEEQMMDYFMGIIDSIDSDGVFLTHQITQKKTFISLSYVVSIAEEQILYDSNPEEAKLIEEYNKEKIKPPALKNVIKPQSMPMPPIRDVSSPFVNPKAMSELVKKAQESYQTKSPS